MFTDYLLHRIDAYGIILPQRKDVLFMNYKRIIAVILAGLFAVYVLAGCSGTVEKSETASLPAGM